MMQLPEFSYPRLRNLAISLAGSALIVGCAGNHVEPAGPNSGTMTTSQMNSTQTSHQIANQNTAPVDNQTTENSGQGKTGSILSKATGAPDQHVDATVTPGISSTNATNATSTVQEPSQTTFYFGVNQSRLSAQDKTVIADHARFLKANPSLILEINGHTDSSGSHAYNEYLSKQRAEAIASLLIQDGVKRSQLVIKALADSKPVADDTSEPGKNRRVELQYDDMSMLSSK